MNPLTAPIHIKVIYDGEVYEVKTNRAEYRNLMQLLNNCIYLESFGECSGQGRCVTCLVKLTNLKSNAGILDRNEKSSIQKAGLSNSNMRLACQILITEELDGAVIDISEDKF